MEKDTNLHKYFCNIITKFFKWCNEYGAAISAIATIVLVFSAITALRQTNEIINQQKSEEFLRLRAYVYPIGMQISTSSSFYIFQIQLRNSGQTPALYLTMGNATINNNIIKTDEIPSKNIGPGDTDRIMIFYQKILTPESPQRYPFTLEFTYQTYNKICFVEKLRGTLLTSPLPNDAFFVDSQDDTSISCPN